MNTATKSPQQVVLANNLRTTLFTIAGVGVLIAAGYLLAQNRIYNWMHGEANMRAHNLQIGLIQYSNAHKGNAPDIRTWQKDLLPYLPGHQMPTPPVLIWERPRQFGLNPALSNRKLSTFSRPDQVVTIYEATASDVNKPDIAAALPPCLARGGIDIAIGFADGHVEQINCAQRAGILKQSNTILDSK